MNAIPKTMSATLRPAPRREGSRTARADARWPAIAATLAALRLRHRRAVRIVDADCAGGALLIETVRHARALGFTAIEGHGIDGSAAMIGRARAAAARLTDPAIGLTFDRADIRVALAAETNFPADLVLWHGDRDQDPTADIAARLAAAGERVVTDRTAASVSEQRA